MIHSRSAIHDFPKDICAAVRESNAWNWTDSSDGCSVSLLIDKNQPHLACASAQGRNGLILRSLWDVSGAAAKLVSLEGPLAGPCLSCPESSEANALSVLSAAALGCKSLSRSRPGALCSIANIFKGAAR